jgi:hypothetical protein
MNDQAFPVSYNGHEGMTLRDYFAAKAMQVLIAKMMNEEGWDFIQEDVAMGSYQMADAMLKERNE